MMLHEFQSVQQSTNLHALPEKRARHTNNRHLQNGLGIRCKIIDQAWHADLVRFAKPFTSRLLYIYMYLVCSWHRWGGLTGISIYVFDCLQSSVERDFGLAQIHMLVQSGVTMA